MGPPVLGSLPDVLREAREDTDAKFVEIAVLIGRVENVIRRFEKGESAPKFGEVDQLVFAYAQATGIDPLELWQRAISRAAEADAQTRMGAAKARAAELGKKRRRNQ